MIVGDLHATVKSKKIGSTIADIEVPPSSFHTGRGGVSFAADHTP